LRALPNPIVPADRKRIRDARPAGPPPHISPTLWCRCSDGCPAVAA
jgi:hypothetical protein